MQFRRLDMTIQVALAAALARLVNRVLVIKTVGVSQILGVLCAHSGGYYCCICSIIPLRRLNKVRIRAMIIYLWNIEALQRLQEVIQVFAAAVAGLVELTLSILRFPKHVNVAAVVAVLKLPQTLITAPLLI